MTTESHNSENNGQMASSKQSNRSTTYEILIRQSRKLGHLATAAFSGAREILNKDITLPPAAEKILGGFSIPLPGSVEQGNISNALSRLIKHSSEVIAGVQTVFPLTLFPHSITLDRTKVTLVKRTSPWSSTTIAVRIEDVLNVSCNLGMFFGAVSIASRVMNSIDHYEIAGFLRSDAAMIQSYIQAYNIAKGSGVSTDHLTIDELRETLKNLSGKI